MGRLSVWKGKGEMLQFCYWYEEPQPPAGHGNWRGDLEQANYRIGAQTCTGTLSESQSLILRLIFLSASCSYSVLFFYPDSFIFLLSSCSPLSFLMFSFCFFLDVPPSTFSFSLSLIFLLSLLYPLIQRFPCKERLLHNHKSYFLKTN